MLVFDCTQLVKLVDPMGGLDAAHRTGQATHDQAVGVRAIAKVLDAFEQFSIGNARSRKENIFGGDQVVHRQDFFEVVAGFPAAAQFYGESLTL